MALEKKLVRVRSRGQMTLPAEVRQRLGIETGDMVVLADTPEGILITPQDDPVLRALDRIGAALYEQGVTLDELIESGREERTALVRERYGLNVDNDPT